MESITLLALQERWMGPALEYTDQSFIRNIIDDAVDLNLKMADNKNPLGLNPEEVFFESHGNPPPNCASYHNSSGNEGNFEYYLNEFYCYRDLARTARNSAISSYTDEYLNNSNFNTRLLETQEKYESELIMLCGKEEDYKETCPSAPDNDEADE